jgi:hypothetical protein
LRPANSTSSSSLGKGNKSNSCTAQSLYSSGWDLIKSSWESKETVCLPPPDL